MKLGGLIYVSIFSLNSAKNINAFGGLYTAPIVWLPSDCHCSFVHVEIFYLFSSDPMHPDIPHGYDFEISRR